MLHALPPLWWKQQASTRWGRQIGVHGDIGLAEVAVAQWQSRARKNCTDKFQASEQLFAEGKLCQTLERQFAECTRRTYRGPCVSSFMQRWWNVAR